MTTTINASPTNGLVQTADGSGILKVQSNGKTTNALAWCCFAGATSAIYSSYNVSSMTNTATGEWIANFTNALADTDYAPVGGATVLASTNAAGIPVTFGDKANSGWGPRTTTTLGINTYAPQVPAWVNPAQVSFVVFGN